MQVSSGWRGLVPVLLALAGIAGCDEAVAPAQDPFQCVGLPSTKCQEMLDEAERSMPASVPVSAVITCTLAVCTEQKGEATAVVVFANGQRVEYGAGWETAGAAPPQPQPVPTGEVGPSPAPVAPSATSGG